MCSKIAIKEKLKVLFGKRNFALINIQNGSIECLVESKRKKIKKEKINFINNNN
jgi:hypothetical protein